MLRCAYCGAETSVTLKDFASEIRDLYSVEQLRRWRDGIAFAVIDIETDEDITKILLA